jgi:hypothetical protein
MTAVPPATPTLPAVATTVTGRSHPSPVPTSTEAPQAGQVVTNISPTMSNPMTKIASDTNQVFCVANLPSVPSGTSLLFRFQKLSSNSDYFSQSVTANGGTKFAWIYGPLQPGQWRCLVEAAGKLAGSAAFTIH